MGNKAIVSFTNSELYGKVSYSQFHKYRESTVCEIKIYSVSYSNSSYNAKAVEGNVRAENNRKVISNIVITIHQQSTLQQGGKVKESKNSNTEQTWEMIIPVEY